MNIERTLAKRIAAAPVRRSPIDIHVGRQLAVIRRARGLSVNDLAQAIAADVGQLAACEAGLERIDAALLIDLATALGVKLSFFFDGLAKVRQPSA